jgi:hypothetical protein
MNDTRTIGMTLALIALITLSGWGQSSAAAWVLVVLMPPLIPLLVELQTGGYLRIHYEVEMDGSGEN